MIQRKLSTNIFLFIFLSLFFISCTTKDNFVLLQSNETNTGSKKPITLNAVGEYRILPHDRLSITLYKESELSGEIETKSELGQEIRQKGVLVNAKGEILLPMIGLVRVGKLTQSAASKKIAKLYAKYIKRPSVYVEVLNKRIVVLGEVKKPGPITLDKEKTTLFEALAFAGDLTNDAVRNDILIINFIGKVMQVRHVDLTHIENLHYASLILHPNDIVYVKPTKWKRFKVEAENKTFLFSAISKALAPFVSLKYLSN